MSEPIKTTPTATETTPTATAQPTTTVEADGAVKVTGPAPQPQQGADGNTLPNDAQRQKDVDGWLRKFCKLSTSAGTLALMQGAAGLNYTRGRLQLSADVNLAPCLETLKSEWQKVADRMIGQTTVSDLLALASAWEQLSPLAPEGKRQTGRVSTGIIRPFSRCGTFKVSGVGAGRTATLEFGERWEVVKAKWVEVTTKNLTANEATDILNAAFPAAPGAQPTAGKKKGNKGNGPVATANPAAPGTAGSANPPTAPAGPAPKAPADFATGVSALDQLRAGFKASAAPSKEAGLTAAGLIAGADKPLTALGFVLEALTDNGTLPDVVRVFLSETSDRYWQIVSELSKAPAAGAASAGPVDQTDASTDAAVLAKVREQQAQTPGAVELEPLARQLYADPVDGIPAEEFYADTSVALATFQEGEKRLPRSAAELEAWMNSAEEYATFLEAHPLTATAPAADKGKKKRKSA